MIRRFGRCFLGLSIRKAEETKNKLLKRDLIKEVSIALGAYRPLKFLVLTSYALELLKSKNHDITLWRKIGQAGFEHRLYQVLIAYLYRKLGYQSFVEARLNEVRVDVLAIGKNERIGIEIELDLDVDVENKLKALEKLDELIIACKEKEMLQKIKREFPPNEKLKFLLLNQLISKLNILSKNQGKKSF